jgi:hypothetical protein
MKVLISKYELRAIEERWPDFEQCPDYVEVDAMFAPLASMSLEQRTRLKTAIETVISKSRSQDRRNQSKIGASEQPFRKQPGTHLLLLSLFHSTEETV